MLDGSVIRPVQLRVVMNIGRQMSETGLNAGWLAATPIAGESFDFLEICYLKKARINLIRQ